jgi:hypothetical protein
LQLHHALRFFRRFLVGGDDDNISGVVTWQLSIDVVVT